MEILKRVESIRRHLDAHRHKNKTIGFIPTMGALHEGHLSLVESSKRENDITVVSIFVNPTQFNQKEDLIKYPRNFEKDKKILKSVDVDYIFAPEVHDIYPENVDTTVNLDISKFIHSMEGPNRPGHFEGVIQVVHRFIKILNPDNIYMGQKDFQQFSIIAYMLDALSIPTRLRVCPTMREKNGLAMSSRNERLTPEIKEKAGIIYDSLVYTKENLDHYHISELESMAINNLTNDIFNPEYFEIFDGFSFIKVSDPADHDLVVAGTAVWAGDVRLIDNMILKGHDLIYKN